MTKYFQNYYFLDIVHRGEWYSFCPAVSSGRDSEVDEDGFSGASDMGSFGKVSPGKGEKICSILNFFLQSSQSFVLR